MGTITFTDFLIGQSQEHEKVFAQISPKRTCIVNEETIERIIREIYSSPSINLAGAYGLWNQARRLGALRLDDFFANRVKGRYEKMWECQPQAREFAEILREEYWGN